MISTVIACLMAFSCISCSEKIKTGKSTKKEMEQTEERQSILVKANPPVAISTSLERINLNKRIERFNDPNKVSYIYLCSDMGQIYTFLLVKGKVSSLNSLLTTPDQIVAMKEGMTGDVKSYLVIGSPDLDGSYGANPDGIFFFTPDDAYCEWNGKYFFCDKPLQLNAQPIMSLEIPD